jgi:cell wall-associated NlpC family hydrolase
MDKTVTSAEWLAALRAKVGTRFRHQGRSGGGMDCIGLVVAAGRDLGIAKPGWEFRAYARTPDGITLEGELDRNAIRVPYNRLQPLRYQAKPGNIILFWVDTVGIPRHIAVYTGVDHQGRDTVIHSYAQEARGVVEMPITSSYWTQRVHAIFKVPGVID